MTRALTDSRNADTSLEIAGLSPAPEDEWDRLVRFVGWGEADRAAASRSVEALFRRGPELVAQTYAYLQRVPETAAILGWEQGVEEAHLEERRRFFTIWLARTLGLDLSQDFARYLFRAGKYHAGHGPRRIHTPPEYVTASVGLVMASFARYMAEAALPGEAVAGAMAAWNKYLAVQLNQMLLGYWAARAVDQGAVPVRVAVFGRLRPLVETAEICVRTDHGARVSQVLQKFLNYFPQARAESLNRVWRSEERADSLWTDVTPVYVPRPGWRILLNGRDLQYAGGLGVPVQPDDKLDIFPPGR